jgi:hypothetical protein
MMFVFGMFVGVVVTLCSIAVIKNLKEIEDNYNELIERADGYESYINSQKEEIVRLQNIIDNK